MQKFRYYFEALHRTFWRSRGKIQIGQYSYGRPKVIRYAGDEAAVSIGKYCSIAKNVTIFTGGNHRTDWVSTYPFRIMFSLPGQYEDGHPSSKGDINIGNDVWLGYGCTILSGLKIGDGAAVAAHAVVVKDVPPYAIVGGNPAKVLAYRFSSKQIEALLKIRWWNWPPADVKANIEMLSSPQIDQFIRRYSN